MVLMAGMASHDFDLIDPQLSSLQAGSMMNHHDPYETNPVTLSSINSRSNTASVIANTNWKILTPTSPFPIPVTNTQRRNQASNPAIEPPAEPQTSSANIANKAGDGFSEVHPEQHSLDGVVTESDALSSIDPKIPLPELDSLPENQRGQTRFRRATYPPQSSPVPNQEAIHIIYKSLRDPATDKVVLYPLTGKALKAIAGIPQHISKGIGGATVDTFVDRGAQIQELATRVYNYVPYGKRSNPDVVDPVMTNKYTSNLFSMARQRSRNESFCGLVPGFKLYTKVFKEYVQSIVSDTMDATLKPENLLPIENFFFQTRCKVDLKRMVMLNPMTSHEEALFTVQDIPAEVRTRCKASGIGLQSLQAFFGDHPDLVRYRQEKHPLFAQRQAEEKARLDADNRKVFTGAAPACVIGSIQFVESKEEKKKRKLEETENTREDDQVAKKMKVDGDRDGVVDEVEVGERSKGMDMVGYDGNPMGSFADTSH
ncbi:hypothetical protein EJ08DRAFT_662079 [Tothia fuscella]|uniref:Uncharacterized protein n=1 Tax=Tothia fuscella TaxID=1048955 RepID=A0A9P4TWC9_9PEZI|nr:hypothetical protein EJ08DRAFT_662079 [Tothia fuscella]